MLAMALIIVMGASSVYVLPRLEDPILNQRAALVHTSFPGANAVRVETLVSEQLEQALKEIEEIRLVRSTSRNEMSTVTMELHDYVYDVDEVWSRVRDKLNDVQAKLPAGASAPEFVDLKFSAYASLVAVKWTSSEPMNAAVLSRFAERLEQRIRTLPGTDDIDLFGKPVEEILIEVDQQKIAAMGLTPADVARVIEASDAKVSAGGLRGSRSEIVVEVDSEFDTLQRIARSPIQSPTGDTVVLLGDVASVRKTVEEPPESMAVVGGQPAIVLGCFIQPEMRIDWWSRNLTQAIDEFASEMPQGVDLEITFLQETYVTHRLSTLLVNLCFAAAAVTMVIMFMMGWRSAIVIGTALPLAGLMVLGGLRLLSIPLHQMSVTGLIIALGLLIDNAIVSVDEIRSRLRLGMSRSQSIINSVQHLAVPLSVSTFTTCLAFAPLALMPGPAGEFVGAIGISVILAVASSLFLSLTVIPALIGIIDRPSCRQRRQRFWQAGVGGPRLYDAYRSCLRYLLARPWLGLVLGILIPAVGFWSARNLPEQFFPASDRDQFQITLPMPPQVSIYETLAATRELRHLALQFENIERVDWYIGESAPAFYYNMLPVRSGMPNYAQAMVQLSSGDKITETIHALQSRLEQRLPQAMILVRQLEQGPPVDAPIMVRVFGPELDQLKQIGQRIRTVFSRIPNVVATNSDVSSSTAKLSLSVDEQQARIAGLTHLEIAQQLSVALDGQSGGSLLEGTEVLPVRIKLKRDQRTNTQQLSGFELVARDEQGQPVQIPVDSIGHWQLVPNDSTIERIDGYRMNEIQVSVRAGVLASTVLDEFKRRWPESGFQMPSGYSIQYAGESAERNRAVTNLLASAGILLVLMAAGLVLSFQSFRLAALIGLVGGLAVGLGLAALAIFGYPFGFMAIVGIMGLVGVAINDSIVVLAALRGNAEARRGQRQAAERVVFRASRHVISTTLTTIAGFMPLILAGGGFWPPLAISVAGGVAGATLLALVFVPSAFVLMFGRQPERRREPAQGNRVREAHQVVG